MSRSASRIVRLRASSQRWSSVELGEAVRLTDRPRPGSLGLDGRYEAVVPGCWVAFHHYRFFLDHRGGGGCNCGYHLCEGRRTPNSLGGVHVQWLVVVLLAFVPVGERNSESCCEHGARLRRRRTSVLMPPRSRAVTATAIEAPQGGWSSRRRWIQTDPPYGVRLPRRSRSPHGSDPPANACPRPAGPSANRKRPAAAGDHARRPPPPSRRRPSASATPPPLARPWSRSKLCAGAGYFGDLRAVQRLALEYSVGS